MAPFEGVFFWPAVMLYSLAAGAHIYALVFREARAVRVGMVPLAGGFVLHSAAIAIRWAATGHIPTVGNYENASFSAWGIILFTVGVSLKYRPLRVIGAFSIPSAVLTMGFGAMSSPKLSPMVAALRSWWLYSHIIFAMLTYGAFFVAFGASVLYLMKEGRQRKGTMTAFLEGLPPLERIEELIFRYVVYGFITYAGMIGTGALWAKNLWGSYWSWDPVETWSLISWMIYGAIIHLRLTMGWKGRRMAWLVIAAVPSVLLVFWGINFAVESSMHIFNVR